LNNNVHGFLDMAKKVVKSKEFDTFKQVIDKGKSKGMGVKGSSSSLGSV
jgi:hypothetical protein